MAYILGIYTLTSICAFVGEVPATNWKVHKLKGIDKASEYTNENSRTNLENHIELMPQTQSTWPERLPNQSAYIVPRVFVHRIASPRALYFPSSIASHRPVLCQTASHRIAPCV